MSLSKVTSRQFSATSKQALAASRKVPLQALVPSQSPRSIRLVHSAPPPHPKSWLTRKVQSSPTAMNVFLSVTNVLGYGSPKQVAGRRSFAIYEQLCARADEDHIFWRQGASRPLLTLLLYLFKVQHVICPRLFNPGLQLPTSMSGYLPSVSVLCRALMAKPTYKVLSTIFS